MPCPTRKSSHAKAKQQGPSAHFKEALNETLTSGSEYNPSDEDWSDDEDKEEVKEAAGILKQLYAQRKRRKRPAKPAMVIEVSCFLIFFNCMIFEK